MTAIVTAAVAEASVPSPGSGGGGRRADEETAADLRTRRRGSDDTLPGKSAAAVVVVSPPSFLIRDILRETPTEHKNYGLNVHKDESFGTTRTNDKTRLDDEETFSGKFRHIYI